MRRSTRAAERMRESAVSWSGYWPRCILYGWRASDRFSNPVNKNTGKGREYACGAQNLYFSVKRRQIVFCAPRRLVSSARKLGLRFLVSAHLADSLATACKLAWWGGFQIPIGQEWRHLVARHRLAVAALGKEALSLGRDGGARTADISSANRRRPARNPCAARFRWPFRIVRLMRRMARSRGRSDRAAHRGHRASSSIRRWSRSAARCGFRNWT